MRMDDPILYDDHEVQPPSEAMKVMGMIAAGEKLTPELAAKYAHLVAAHDEG